MADITVYGAGYVGCVTSACLAELGHRVLNVDVDSKKIDQLQQGIPPIYEPGLDEYLSKHLNTSLWFTTSLTEGIHHGDIQFIAVGTPSDQDGSADLKYVLQVANTIGQYIEKNVLVVNKSTVPVGTGHHLKKLIDDVLYERGQDINCSVVSNPEFLREGTAIKDFMQADRIVIGCDEQQSATIMQNIYQPLTQQGIPLVTMDVLSSELTKYASNAFLAAKISLINEISELAESYSANIDKVSEAIGLDPRIAPAFLKAGVGYGGSCFPKDVRALKNMAYSQDLPCDLLNAVETVNERRKYWIYHKLKMHFDDQLEHLTIALWGLSFKPNTDDMREAASCYLIEVLSHYDSITIKAYDPAAMPVAKELYPNHPTLTFVDAPQSALIDADVLLVTTEWPEFRNVNVATLKNQMTTPLIIDGRNIYDLDTIKQAGNIDYISVGRPPIYANSHCYTA